MIVMIELNYSIRFFRWVKKPNQTLEIVSVNVGPKGVAELKSSRTDCWVINKPLASVWVAKAEFERIDHKPDKYGSSEKHFPV